MNRRRICVITGSRADYGLLYWLLKAIDEDNELELQLIATGMHLSPEFGLTYKIIEADGFNINNKIEILLSSDSERGISKSVGLGCISFSEALNDLNSDMVVILGDRFEIFSAATAAMISKIPIVHLHGGESTQGVIDESIRHAITKMATYHFPATEIYRKRIIQMGESPDRVFNYGMAGLDNIYNLDLLSKEELEDSLNFSFEKKLAIVTYHPVTLENNTAEMQVDNLLKAIDESGIKTIFTKSNADTNGRIINQKIRDFVEKNKDCIFVVNLGQLKYLSVLKYADLMVGNSSSGILEAPSFKLPVVNIGFRQQGRVKANNIIDCDYKYKNIKSSIKKAISDNFRDKMKFVSNPYDKFKNGDISLKIKEKLKILPLDNDILKKSFYDLHS